MLTVSKKLSAENINAIENYFNQQDIENIINAAQTLLSFLYLEQHQIKDILNRAKDKIYNNTLELEDSNPVKNIITQKGFLFNLLNIVKNHAEEERQLILYRDIKKIFQLHIQATTQAKSFEFYQEQIITNAIKLLGLPLNFCSTKYGYKLKPISDFTDLNQSVQRIKYKMDCALPNAFNVNIYRLGSVFGVLYIIYLLLSSYEKLYLSIKLLCFIAVPLLIYRFFADIRGLYRPNDQRFLKELQQFPDVKLDLQSVEQFSYSDSKSAEPQYTFAIFERNTVNPMLQDNDIAEEQTFETVEDSDGIAETEAATLPPKSPKRYATSPPILTAQLPLIKSPASASTLLPFNQNKIWFARENAPFWEQHCRKLTNKMASKAVHFFGFFNKISLGKQNLSEDEIKAYADRVINGKFVKKEGSSGIKYLKPLIQLNPHIGKQTMGPTLFTTEAKTGGTNPRCLARKADQIFSENGDNYILLDFCYEETNQLTLGHRN